MGKIITTDELSTLEQEKKSGKKIILVGGCFDILHAGHIAFLTRAKALEGILTIMLESDEKVKMLKGQNRPINSQNKRAAVLSNLSAVDYVVNLPYLSNNDDYKILVKKIEPDIIAVTEGSRVYTWEKLYMNRTGGKIVHVIKRLKNYSTTKIARNAKL